MFTLYKLHFPYLVFSMFFLGILVLIPSTAQSQPKPEDKCRDDFDHCFS